MKRRYVVIAGVFALLLIFGIQVGEQMDTPFLSVKANPYFSPTELDQPTPLITPSAIVFPSENYSVPPLSSLILKVVDEPYGSSIGGLIYVKGGSGNDINFRVIDPQGKIILDLGRISNETSFHFYANKPGGDFTFIFDNEFSVFSSKEVDVFSYTYPNSDFEFAGFSINFWVIILVVMLFATLMAMALVVWLSRRKQK